VAERDGREQQRLGQQHLLVELLGDEVDGERLGGHGRADDTPSGEKPTGRTRAGVDGAHSARGGAGRGSRGTLAGVGPVRPGSG
jgi:hypothetical protein